jgi:hypothetical protein
MLLRGRRWRPEYHIGNRKREVKPNGFAVLLDYNSSLPVCSPSPRIGAGRYRRQLDGGMVTATAATKSDHQTGTSNVLAVTPLHQQDHASAIKTRGPFVGSSGSVSASYGVSDLFKGYRSGSLAHYSRRCLLRTAIGEPSSAAAYYLMQFQNSPSIGSLHSLGFVQGTRRSIAKQIATMTRDITISVFDLITKYAPQRFE